MINVEVSRTLATVILWTCIAFWCVASPISILAQSPKERREIQLLSAETEFRLGESKETRMSLLHALEEVALVSCAAQRTAQQAVHPKPLSPECQNYIARIEALYPLSPIIVCLQKGILSSDCSTAYSSTEIIPEKLVGTGDLFHFPGRGTPQALERIQAKARFKEDPSAPNRVKLNEVYSPLLWAACFHSTLEIIPTEQYEQRFPSKKKGPSESEDLIDLLNQLGGPREHPSEDKKELDPTKRFVRLRIISTDCDELAEELAAADPSSSLALCARHGFYTPPCFAARSKERKSTTKATGASKKLLDTF